MSVDAFEMALVHGAFRRELTSAPSLIHNVEAGDTQRSSTVGGHVAFMADALHHHHAAEDAVIWPKLRARAATSEVDVTRMEDTHREIADYIERVRTVATSWSACADPRWPTSSSRRSKNSGLGWTSTSPTKSATSFRSSMTI